MKMNPWLRKAAIEKADAGADYTYPAFPEWVVTVAPSSNWSARMQRAVVAAASNPDVAAYLERQRTPGYVATPEDAAFDNRMLIDLYAGALVLGWTVTDADGTALSCTKENVARVFAAFPDMFEGVKAFSQNIENYPQLSDPEKAELISKN